MTLEDSMADAFDRIISGETINERVEDWNVSNLNSPLIVDLMYSTSVIYGFQILLGDVVQFSNFHREAREGTGTKSLMQLEASFQALALRRGKNVEILFNPSGQEDTKIWLQKNRYICGENGIYRKQFSPNPSQQ